MNFFLIIVHQKNKLSFSQTCILFDLRTIPWPSYVILELVRIYENQWTQERNKDYQTNIQDSEQWILLEDEVAQQD